ncbi:MAG TPA: Lrp/AsnC family transcriptional regulator [Desulfobacterales bacterium]|jgi:Lrp/AsnC family leucine-responsive transcriptional regulator|nr:Lrp/AsnC family transcriptional regulator [Desulfobacterales bacterium]
MDDISLKILKILQEKARVPNIEVARQVGMAPSGVLERVRKLEQQGIIDGYEVRLNPARFDRSLVAFVLVAPQPDSDESKLGGALAAVPDVQEVHYVAGEDGFMIKIRAADTVRLERIRREKIAALPQVRSTRTMIVLQTYKETARIPLDDSSIQKIRKRRT